MLLKLKKLRVAKMPQYNFRLEVDAPENCFWAYVSFRNQPYPFCDPATIKAPILNGSALITQDAQLGDGDVPKMDFSQAIVEAPYRRRLLVSEQKQRVLGAFQEKASPLIREALTHPNHNRRRYSVAFNVADGAAYCGLGGIRTMRGKPGPMRYKGIGEE